MVFTNGMELLNRAETMASLIARDGLECRVPGCKHPTEFTEANPPTIEHVIPRAKGGTDDMANLEVAHQKCNNWKGDRLYIGVDENGIRVLEPLPYRERKTAVAKRPPTECCNEGHDLGEGEVCDVCGSLPQPSTFPKWAQANPKECDHDLFHCRNCVLGFVPRVPASVSALVEYDGSEIHDPDLD